MNEIWVHTVTLSSLPSHIFSPPPNTAVFHPYTSSDISEHGYGWTLAQKRKKLLSRDIYQVKQEVISLLFCCGKLSRLVWSGVAQCWERRRQKERKKEKEGETAQVSIRKCWGGWKVLITRTKNMYISFSFFTRLSFPLLGLNALKLPHLPSENETEVAQINRKRAAVPLTIRRETCFTGGFTDRTSDFWWFLFHFNFLSCSFYIFICYGFD